MLSQLISLDHRLFFLINSTLAHRALDSVFEGLSSLGGWTVGLLTIVLLATEGKRSLGRHLMLLALFLFITAAVNNHLKATIDRSRPTAVFETHPRDAEGPLLRVLELDPPRRNSFPSGHSMTAFFMLVYAGRRRRGFQPWLLALASGIALARVYVGVHFPFDCLAGSLLGAAGALLAFAVFQRLEDRVWTPSPARRTQSPPPTTASAPCS